MPVSAISLLIIVPGSIINVAPSLTYTYPFKVHSLSEVRVVVVVMLPVIVLSVGTLIGPSIDSFLQLNKPIITNIKQIIDQDDDSEDEDEDD